LAQMTSVLLILVTIHSDDSNQNSLESYYIRMTINGEFGLDFSWLQFVVLGFKFIYINRT